MMDNYSLWEAHEERQERELAKRPVCFCCGEHIQEDYYFEINEEAVCKDCLNLYFRKEVDDYL